MLQPVDVSVAADALIDQVDLVVLAILVVSEDLEPMRLIFRCITDQVTRVPDTGKSGSVLASLHRGGDYANHVDARIFGSIFITDEISIGKRPFIVRVSIEYTEARNCRRLRTDGEAITKDEPNISVLRNHVRQSEYVFKSDVRLIGQVHVFSDKNLHILGFDCALQCDPI